jgi:hypothetical protein
MAAGTITAAPAPQPGGSRVRPTRLAFPKTSAPAPIPPGWPARVLVCLPLVAAEARRLSTSRRCGGNLRMKGRAGVAGVARRSVMDSRPSGGEGVVSES